MNQRLTLEVKIMRTVQVCLSSYFNPKYKIKKENVLGHSDITPERKKDPGEKFPWYLLARSKLCLWPNLKLKNLKVSCSQ